MNNAPLAVPRSEVLPRPASRPATPSPSPSPKRDRDDVEDPRDEARWAELPCTD